VEMVWVAMTTHEHPFTIYTAEAGDTEGGLVLTKGGKVLATGGSGTTWEGDD